MFHKFHGPLLPFSIFLLHLLRSILMGLVLITLALLMGMLGYHGYENMSWVDAFVNAAMILSGMGPVSTLMTDGGKIFAGFYALFSGLFFILILGIILSPVAHRLFHQLHIALSQKKSG
jgi:hypothetical protein